MFKASDWVAICGVTMLMAGAAMVFGTYDALPLWAIWIIGPLLWYLGAAVTVAGIAAHFLIAEPNRAEKEETMPVLHLEHVGRRNAPVGIVREIPAMGGFIL
ncbi:MAG: hypothetical protein LAN37_06345 [Acidobacteriia bacterium]|jgi:hypothetical protein|nr:hypothetical protein [Terriglobia bacterium]